MRRFFYAVFLVVACATVAAADPYDDAVSAVQRKDYALAARLFRPLAEQGYPPAQYNLGMMYANGWGGQKDGDQALHWLKLSADQGQGEAQFYLGSENRDILLFRDGLIQTNVRASEEYIRTQLIPSKLARCSPWEWHPCWSHCGLRTSTL